MVYMGSKRRIAKYILPIILEGRTDGQYYVEPFAGGMNMMDKVGGNRIANDSNVYLIEMWKYLSEGWIPPMRIEKHYYNEVRECYNKNGEKFGKPLIGWIGFMGSYNGRFFDGGYSGHKVGNRDYISEQIKNTLLQVPLLKDVCFISCDYKDLVLPSNSIIYCDPPYEGTKKYSYSIDHDIFWQWCRDKVNEGQKVFVSEYNAPDDFECVWEMEITNSLHQTNTKRAVEKLFTYKNK